MNITNDVQFMGFGFPGPWRHSGMRLPQHMHTPYAPPELMPTMPGGGYHHMQPRHHHVHRFGPMSMRGADVEFLGSSDLVSFMDAPTNPYVAAGNVTPLLPGVSSGQSQLTPQELAQVQAQNALMQQQAHNSQKSTNTMIAVGVGAVALLGIGYMFLKKGT